MVPCPCLGEAVALLGVAGGQRHIAQQAETRRRVRIGVVAGRAYQRKPLGAVTALVGGSNGIHHSKRCANSLCRQQEDTGSCLLGRLSVTMCVPAEAGVP